MYLVNDDGCFVLDFWVGINVENECMFLVGYEDGIMGKVLGRRFDVFVFVLIFWVCVV